MSRQTTTIVVAVSLSCLLADPASAATYTVTITDNAGAGSLRWAINQANVHLGGDAIVFDPTLMGEGIRPSYALPILTDNQTTIEGDIDVDGRPDIALNGKFAGDVVGLEIRGDECTISGLAVVRFARSGILLHYADNCMIRKCHIGVNLAGDAAYEEISNRLRAKLDEALKGLTGNRSRTTR